MFIPFERIIPSKSTEPSVLTIKLSLTLSSLDLIALAIRAEVTISVALINLVLIEPPLIIVSPLLANASSSL